METEKTTLRGLSVLLTRPAQQSMTLTARIEQAGGHVCQLPLIEIEAITDADAVAELKQKILNLDRYDAAIFISTNAANLGLEWIERYWPQLPTGLTAFAVGPGTAKVLARLPWPVYHSARGVTSEDLLALPQLKHIKGQRIALFRGQGGRELLAETLRQRGAEVDYLELYRRQTPDYSSSSVDDLLRQHQVNVIVVTSSQILEVLMHLLSDSADFLTLPVIVPSRRVLEQAHLSGFTRVLDAGGADDDALFEALQHLQEPLYH
ncbi:MAG: uroporphyrinogen-III synthase [Pseudomonadales bacterium]|nr:uroporphyrinogen-III synthase [Pseudomonadales bacterium]